MKRRGSTLARQLTVNAYACAACSQSAVAVMQSASSATGTIIVHASTKPLSRGLVIIEVIRDAGL